MIALILRPTETNNKMNQERLNTEIKEIKKLFEEFDKFLLDVTKNNVSTNENTPESLLWEIYNTFFTVTISCLNAIDSKDSLVIHLLARYTYELLVIFLYIFCDEQDRETRAKQFLSFNQFKTVDRKWTNLTLKDMISNLPDKKWLSSHETLYRNLSNFAHPSMDSFMLRRRGTEAEYAMILSTSYLILQTMIEIIDQCRLSGIYPGISKNPINPERIKYFTDKCSEYVKTN
jgi:hypothetical protein